MQGNNASHRVLEQCRHKYRLSYTAPVFPHFATRLFPLRTQVRPSGTNSDDSILGRSLQGLVLCPSRQLSSPWTSVMHRPRSSFFVLSDFVIRLVRIAYRIAPLLSRLQSEC